MDRTDLKEKLIILGITAGVFLPIRLVFTSFVSDDWLGSLGLMTIFAILLVFLIKMKKLGKIGLMFERQIRKTIGGKTGKYIIGFAFFFLLYFGATLFFIDRGNTIYEEDNYDRGARVSRDGGYQGVFDFGRHDADTHAGRLDRHGTTEKRR